MTTDTTTVSPMRAGGRDGPRTGSRRQPYWPVNDLEPNYPGMTMRTPKHVMEAQVVGKQASQLRESHALAIHARTVEVSHQHGILEGFLQLETQRVLDERLEHVGLMSSGAWRLATDTTVRVRATH